MGGVPKTWDRTPTCRRRNLTEFAVGVVLPDSVAVFLNVLGIPWINVDEDQVHETARHIRTFVTDLDNTLQSANEYMSALENEYSGQGYRQLLAEWAAADSTHMSALRTGGTTVAGVLDAAGTMIAALKTVAIAEIVALFTAAGALLVSGVGTTLQPVVAAAVRRIVLALKIAVEEYIFGELLELAVTEFEDVVRDVVEGIADFAYRVTAAALDTGGTPPELRLDPEEARRYADAIAGLGDEIAGHHAELTDNLARVGDGNRSDLLDDAPTPLPGIGSGTTKSATAPPGTTLAETRILSGGSPLPIAPGKAAGEYATPEVRAEHPLPRATGATGPGQASALTPEAGQTAHATTTAPAHHAAAAPAEANAAPAEAALPAVDIAGSQTLAEVGTAPIPPTGHLPMESPATGSPNERIGGSVPLAAASEPPEHARISQPGDSPGTNAAGTPGPTTATANSSTPPSGAGLSRHGLSSRRSAPERGAATGAPDKADSRPSHHITGERLRTPWTKVTPKSGKPPADRTPWARPAPAVSAPTEAGTPPTVSICPSPAAPATDSVQGAGRIDATVEADVSVPDSKSIDGEAERRDTGRIQ